MFQRILKHSNEGIIITIDDKIILCNQNFYDIFNIKGENRNEQII